MARRHVMTPRRRVALRKAQLSSARKRKGHGKSRFRTVNRSRLIKHVAIGVGTAAVLGTSAYVYRHREKMIVAPGAVHIATGIAKLEGKSKTEVHRVRKHEIHAHAHRSTYRVREQQIARQGYRQHEALRRQGKRSWRYKDFSGSYVWTQYSRDRNNRARSRLRKMQGKKAKPFDYGSGKVRMVHGRRVYRLPI